MSTTPGAAQTTYTLNVTVTEQDSRFHRRPSRRPPRRLLATSASTSQRARPGRP
ncbi:MAG: hypothetical protein U0521_16085 [Anaerolineae bacterium]